MLCSDTWSTPGLVFGSVHGTTVTVTIQNHENFRAWLAQHRAELVELYEAARALALMESDAART